jgi:DNA-binding protein H-NS
MKSDNKSLANDISAAILGKLHGLNAKSAKKLVKAVDECSKDIVKKFAKLQKDEENEQEKDAKKATKKAAEKAKKVAKAKEKAAEKAALNAKIAIVTNDKTVAPKAPAKPAPAPAKKPVAKAKPAPKPAAPKVEPVKSTE